MAKQQKKKYYQRMTGKLIMVIELSGVQFGLKSYA